MAAPVHYRHLAIDTDRNGVERVYLRRPGHPKVRLRALRGTPEFDVEYRLAISGETAAKSSKQPAALPGSLRALCQTYFASDGYRFLSPRTRQVRRLILDKLCEEHGDKAADRLEPRHIRGFRNAKENKPEAGNSIVKALRALFENCENPKLHRNNPAKTVKYFLPNLEGFHSWTLEEVRRFEAHHPVGSRARLALALLFYTGQRRSDVVRFGPAHMCDGKLQFTRAKNRVRRPVTLKLPIVPALRAVIEATPCGNATFLETEFGKPFTARPC